MLNECYVSMCLEGLAECVFNIYSGSSDTPILAPLFLYISPRNDGNASGFFLFLCALARPIFARPFAVALGHIKVIDIAAMSTLSLSLSVLLGLERQSRARGGPQQRTDASRQM